MDGIDRHSPMDEDLRALAVYDASPDRAARTRAACLAALAARTARAGTRATFRPAGWMAWGEPLAAIGVSAVYLAAAVQASMALLRP